MNESHRIQTMDTIFQHIERMTLVLDLQCRILKANRVVFQTLGMSESEAARLAASIDWTNTLLMPIPEEFATFSEVRVAGTSGLALSSLDGVNSALMWQDGGRVYVISGPLTARELVRAANSLR